MPSITKSIGIMMLVSASTSVLAAPLTADDLTAEVTLAGLNKNDPCVYTTPDNMRASLTGICKQLQAKAYVPLGTTKENIQKCLDKETEDDRRQAESKCPGINACDLTTLQGLVQTCWLGGIQKDIDQGLSLPLTKKKGTDMTTIEVDNDGDSDGEDVRTPKKKGSTPIQKDVDQGLSLPLTKKKGTDMTTIEVDSDGDSDGEDVRQKKGSTPKKGSLPPKKGLPTPKKGLPTPKKGFPVQGGEKNTGTSVTVQPKKEGEEVDVTTQLPKDVESDDDCLCAASRKTKKAAKKSLEVKEDATV